MTSAHHMLQCCNLHALKWVEEPQGLIVGSQVNPRLIERESHEPRLIERESHEPRLIERESNEPRLIERESSELQTD